MEPLLSSSCGDRCGMNGGQCEQDLSPRDWSQQDLSPRPFPKLNWNDLAALLEQECKDCKAEIKYRNPPWREGGGNKLTLI